MSILHPGGEAKIKKQNTITESEVFSHLASKLLRRSEIDLDIPGVCCVVHSRSVLWVIPGVCCVGHSRCVLCGSFQVCVV